MIPTTVSSSTSTATVSGATGNNHSTSNNGQLNMLPSTATPTANSVSSTATSPPSAQTPSVLLGLASLILEGRAVADDEYQLQMMRTTAPVSDTSGLSGSGQGGGIGSGTGSNLHNYNTNNMPANTSYGVSGSGVVGATVGGGRQSPTSRPSTSRAAAGFGGSVGSGHVINITTNPYAFNSSGVGAAYARDSSPLYIDPYSVNSSGSASSTAESTHQRWTQKLCQLRQVSPAANLSTTYEQPVAVEAREPELVALAINESSANDRGDFEIVRRSLLNRTNLNAISCAASSTAATGNSAGAGSASSSPGSGPENFLFSLQSLATTCLRSGSPSIEPNHGGMSANNATGTPSSFRFATLSSPPPPQSMYIYRATTPTASPSASATAHRFLEQPGSGSSCGSGVQSPRPHWASVVDNMNTKERYMRHASATTGLNFGSGRIPIPGTAVNTTSASVAMAAAATINHTTKVMPTTTAVTIASKHPQQGPHCDQFLRKMGLAKGEAAEVEDHFCDMSYVNITCSRWRAYCHKIEAIIGRGEPVCIEVYLGPVNHKMLLEQWIITQKEKVPPPTMTLPSLCSAIRSQLYFSQISAWCDLIKKSDKTIYDTGRIIFHTPTGAAGDLATPVGSTTTGNNITPGTSPNSTTLINQLNNALLVNQRPRLNIFYRIKSFDSTACFNSKPNVHNFPNVNISENCSISVCLKSLPRINGGIPKIGTIMLTTPGTAIATPTITTTSTTATATTMLATATTKATSNKTKTTKSTAPSATTILGGGMSNLTPRVAAKAEATQWLTKPNGSTNINSSDSDLTSFRNGNSCGDVKSKDTPCSSRPTRCGIATTSTVAAPTSTLSSSSINLHSNSSATKSISNSASVSNGASCVSSNAKPRNDCGDTQDSKILCSRANCAPKHKCVFFIDEDELLPVDEADGEAYGDEDDNPSDAANSTGDSITQASAFCTGANMSHREKQLMKYRKRMLKRDKKHHQHHPHKPLTTNTDATCELDATYQQQRAQQERNETNCCQPMEEGDEEDAASHCSDTMTTLFSRTSTRIEMISTGTQTPMSCCRQCGCEKTLICMRCTSGVMCEEQAIDEPTEQDVDDMDDSTASSISSSEIIHTPRNKAELLLQAIQRTPKAAAAKHKKEQPRKLCGGKSQNNNHLNGVTATHVNVGGKSSGSSLHENTLAGCRVCKRQKTQHNFGNSNGEEATATTSEHLADEADNDDIGDDADDDGGKKREDIKFVVEDADRSQLVVTPLTALPTSTQIMEEESFISSTKLTPQIDRCTLSNVNNTSRYPLLTRGDHAGGDQKVDGGHLSENRTPPPIITLINREHLDESQFKTPTTAAAGGVNYEISEQLQTQQHQQGVDKAFQHHQTPKPNLLQLHCNYHSDVSAGGNQALGAAGDGFAVVRANNNELPTAVKPHQQPQQHGVHNALLLRKGLPKVNLTPIFCNPMPSPTGVSITSSHSSPIPIHGATNDITFCFEPAALNRSGNHLQLHHQLMHSSSGNVCASPLTTEVNNIPVQKSYSAPTLPNSPSLSPRFAKQAAIYKRRSRHLSDRSDRSSLCSDEQFSDEDLESAGMYSPASSPLKQSARVAAAFGRLPLLGNLEESLLQKCLVPKVEVTGFTVLLGASGGFCPTQLTIPAASYFYELRGESLSTPYVCEIRLPRKGYSVPRAGNVQATLLNPMGTVVRMFVIPYDMRDMPPLHQTFIRQRILAEASTHEAATAQNVQTRTTMEHQSDSVAMSYTNGYGGIGRGSCGGGGGAGAGGGDNLSINNNNNECYQSNNKNNSGNNNNNAKNKYRLSPSGGLHGESNLGHFISAENMKRLRYSIHLRFQTSRSGRLSLHTDIRLLISRRTDCDTAAAHAKGVLEAPNDLVTDTVMPTNPKYSARQDQSNNSSNGNGNGNGSGGSGSNGSNINDIAAAVSATNSTIITTNCNNGSGSSKI